MELNFSDITNALIPLLGVWLGSYLTKNQIRNQSLIDTRRATYAKLLAVVMSEESYPEIYGSADSYIPEKVEKYNEKLGEWRKNRKFIKGLATECLLITTNQKLFSKFSDFISSQDPEKNLRDIKTIELMKEEINFIDRFKVFKYLSNLKTKIGE